MTSGKVVLIREGSFSTVSRDVEPHMCNVRSRELTMELEYEPCQRCQAFSICYLDDSGYTDVTILRRNAGIVEGQGGTSCGLCSIV